MKHKHDWKAVSLAFEKRIVDGGIIVYAPSRDPKKAFVYCVCLGCKQFKCIEVKEIKA